MGEEVSSHYNNIWLVYFNLFQELESVDYSSIFLSINSYEFVHVIYYNYLYSNDYFVDSALKFLSISNDYLGIIFTLLLTLSIF